MRPFRLNRRAMLRGAGGAVLGLPLLEVMESKRAHAAAPKRLVVWNTNNGTIYNAWKPSGAGTSFTLPGAITAPLDPWKSKLVFVDGLEDKAATRGPGDDHMRGMASQLTGNQLLAGNIQGGAGTPAGLASSLSVDQKIANAVGTGTRFKSLELGVMAALFGGNPLVYISYSGPGTPLPPQDNPSNVFTRLFSTFTPPSTTSTTSGPDPADVQRVAEEQSVVDAVKGTYERLLPKVSTEDRKRLDAHLTQVRELEKRIKPPATTTTTTVVGSSCVKPTAPSGINHRSHADIPKIGKAQIDMMVMALACDMTRVASLQWGWSAGDLMFSWLGVSRGQHSLSHEGDSNTAAQADIVKINAWYASQFAYLLEKMASVKEGDGTLLDNSVVVWMNELAKGNNHSHRPMVYVLAGGCGGAFATGRYVQTTEPHNNLLVSLMNMMGVAGTTFGNPQDCTGALRALGA